LKVANIFFTFILFSFEITLAKDIYTEVANSKKWEALLHLGNISKVAEHFYLSYPNISLEAELKKTLNAFKSKNNKDAICNFPARYLFLKKFFDLPEFDLESCKDLQKFIKNFPKDRLGIVYSSEYVNSPQSAFGHVMLVFKDNKKDLIISDVVHFAALTEKENFFIYSYKGLTGKFDAFYIREPFFKRKYLYNDLEQRFIYIYWLNYNQKNIKYLIYHLYELRKFKTRYYFISDNCASATYNLLEIIDPDIPSIKDQIFLPKLLPIHVVKSVERRIYNKSVMYPLIVKVKVLVDTMSYQEKKQFFDIITFKEQVDDYSKLPDIVKESLKYYFEFKFRTQHFIYPDYNQVVSLSYKETKFKNIFPDPLNKTKFAKLSIFYSDKKNC